MRQAYSITSVNLDGACGEEDEVGRAFLWECSGLRDGVGGLICLQDVRSEEGQGASNVKGWLAGRAEEAAVEKAELWGVYAAPPWRSREEDGKLMGGVYVGVWGDLRARAVSLPQEDHDEHGRWVGVKLEGKNKRAVVVVTCYRPPGGSMGGLVAREARRRGWKADGTGKRRVRDAFFDELGECVRRWRSRGWEVVLTGDFNVRGVEDTDIGGLFRTWWGDLGLLDVRSEAGDEAPTFTYRREGELRESTIDYVLMTPTAAQQWGGGALQSTAKPWVDREPGHRLLTVGGGGGFTQWLSLGVSGRLWRARCRAARAAAHAARAAPRIDKEREVKFRKEVELRLDDQRVREILDWIHELAEWGGSLWEGRPSHAEEKSFVGAEGALVPVTALPVGVPCVEGLPAVLPAGGTWKEFVGWEAGVVLQAVQQKVTAVEEQLAVSLLEGSWALGKRGGSKVSRRKMDGWFPTIGQERREVRAINKVLGILEREGWAACRRKVRKLEKRKRWLGQPAPDGGGAQEWGRWEAGLRSRLGRVKAGLQGAKRRARRECIADHVAKREQAFVEGSLGKVVRSVLGSQKAGGTLTVVEQDDGTQLTSPAEVKRATSHHFQRAFAGAGTTPWYERRAVSAEVKSVYEDTARGRRVREELRCGAEPEGWGQLGEEGDAIKAMLRSKRWRCQETGRERQVEEDWYGGVLEPITMAEWQTYWGGKSRFTSPGTSGVRPDLMRAAPEVVQEYYVELYSACLRLKVVPSQWKRSIVVPIPKKPGATSLNDLRPLKLLEVTRKAVLGIVKARIKDVLEREGVLHPAQHGFRSGRSTATAAMALLNAVEEARFLRRDLHVLCLDIRKAYDTVVRAVGVEGALRRLGVPMEVAELLMEVERGNENEVRTAWDPLLEVEDYLFPAERGFVQGSAISPLLWIVFYDMVLGELSARGVGGSITPDTGWSMGGAGGLIAFADDTSVLAASVERLQRDAEELLVVFGAVCLETAPAKSVHMPLVYNRTTGNHNLWLWEEVGQARGGPLRMGGVAVPHKEADEGNRFLGFIIDLLGDGGDQMARLEQSIDEFGAGIRRARASKGIVAYLVEAVLIPRVMYPLTVATLTPDQIRRLESRALRWVLPKLGLSPSFSRNLVGMGTELGGLGWTRWTVRVAVAKSQLAMELREHPEAGIRGTWASMRTRALGGMAKVRSPHVMGLDDGASGQGGMIDTSWLASLDAHLAELHVRWADGWQLPTPRVGDVLLSEVVYQGVRSGRLGLQDGMAIMDWVSAADLWWRSDLLCGEGVKWWEWPAKCAWMGNVQRIRELVEGGGYEPLGEWMGRGSGAEGGVWGQGLRTESLVRRRRGGGDAARREGGIIRSWSGVGEPPRAKVEWFRGEWCCSDSCTQCGPGEGRWWREVKLKTWKTSETVDMNLDVSEHHPDELDRIWGMEWQPKSAQRKRAVWVCNPEQLLPSREGGEEHRDGITQAAPPPLWRFTRGRGVGGGHWCGERAPQVEAVRREWAANRTVLAVTDGSFTRGEGGTAVLGGGWVLGGRSTQGESLAGDEPGKRSTIIGRGGFAFRAAGSKPSSYLAELAGVLDLVRGLMEGVEEGKGPGAVSHFCDNEGVVKLIRGRGGLTRRQWRSRPCRNLWGELRGRLQWWTENGGTWQTNWVKGHVDEDKTRAPASYTVAEQLNFEADRLAGEGSAGVVEEVGAGDDHLGSIPAGKWWVKQPSGLQVHWDGVPRMLEQQGRALAGAEYWRQRQRQRGVTVFQTQVGWDTRITGKCGKQGAAKSALDVFRTQLWWNHLMTPEVLSRGKKPGEVRQECELCGAEGVATAWHILGECSYGRLVESRSAAAKMLRERVVKLVPAKSECRRLWHDAFNLIAGKRWQCPEGWGQEGGGKAGTAANPWFGCIPREWFDTWIVDLDAAPHSEEWLRGRSILNKLSAAAVEACHMVWGEYVRWWAEQQRKGRGSEWREEVGREVDARTPGVHETELLEHVVLRKTYEKAVEELYLRREQLLKRRRLTQGERRIMRWREWSMTEVIAWWQQLTAQGREKVGKGKRKAGAEAHGARRVKGRGGKNAASLGGRGMRDASGGEDRGRAGAHVGGGGLAGWLKKGQKRKGRGEARKGGSLAAERLQGYQRRQGVGGGGRVSKRQKCQEGMVGMKRRRGDEEGGLQAGGGGRRPKQAKLQRWIQPCAQGAKKTEVEDRDEPEGT